MAKFSPHEKIGDIQVLRGIAILMVLICHLSIGSMALELWPVRVTIPLYLGVEIFFVVSGYVITRSLMKDGFHGGRFFLKRVFRLMPALLLFIGVSLLLNRYVQNSDLIDTDKSFYSVPNRAFRQQARGVAFGYLTFVPRPLSHANGAMWSLSVEDQFYAAVTIACLLAGGVLRLRPKWCGAVLAAAAAAFYVCLVGWRLATWGDLEKMPSVVRYFVHWRFDFLGLGVVTAFADHRWGERIRAVFRENGNYCSGFLLIVPLMLAAVCESPLQEPAPVLQAVGYTMFGLCFAGLVLLAANGLAFPAGRGLLYRWFKFVGDRSYTYYLFHYPMFIVAFLLFHHHFQGAFRGPWHFAVAQCVTVVALLVPFSEAVYRCIELPIAELGRSIAGRLKSTDFGVASPQREPLLDRELGGQSIVAGQCNPVLDGKDVAQQRRLGRRVA